MWRVGIHRRLVALFAAYGLVLQGLLAAVAAVAPTLAADAVVCSVQVPAHGAPGHAPPHGSDCTLCPLICCGAIAPPARPASLAPIVGASDAVPAPRSAILIARTILRAGLARAPPV
jgi:hypothetical protein